MGRGNQKSLHSDKNKQACNVGPGRPARSELGEHQSRAGYRTSQAPGSTASCPSLLSVLWMCPKTHSSTAVAALQGSCFWGRSDCSRWEKGLQGQWSHLHIDSKFLNHRKQAEFGKHPGWSITAGMGHASSSSHLGRDTYPQQLFLAWAAWPWSTPVQMG